MVDGCVYGSGNAAFIARYAFYFAAFFTDDRDGYALGPIFPRHPGEFDDKRDSWMYQGSESHRASFGDDSTVIQENDIVGKSLHFVKVMGAEEYGSVSSIYKIISDEGVNAVFGDGIYVACWFVQGGDGGGSRECAGG